jgi:hypothetical protein
MKKQTMSIPFSIRQEMALLKQHADEFAKCSMALCKAEEKADTIVRKAANDKVDLKAPIEKFIKQSQAMKRELAKAKERKALLQCRYEHCESSTRAVMKDIIEGLKDIPQIYTKGKALLRKKKITPEDYVKFMTSI